jgi:hypothetical protein
MAKLYISYSWSKDSSQVADQIEQAVERAGIDVDRDVDRVKYKDNINDFMREIGRANAVIVVLSHDYLQSWYCMFELVGVYEAGEMKRRVFPILIEDAEIFDRAVDYQKHWKGQLEELEKNVAAVGLAAAGNAASKARQFQKFINLLPEILDDLREMNTMTLAMHQREQWQSLVRAIEQSLGMTGSPASRPATLAAPLAAADAPAQQPAGAAANAGRAPTAAMPSDGARPGLFSARNISLGVVAAGLAAFILMRLGTSGDAAPEAAPEPAAAPAHAVDDTAGSQAADSASKGAEPAATGTMAPSEGSTATEARQYSCRQINGLQSRQRSNPTSITVVNNTGQRVKLAWLNQDGVQEDYGAIDSGTTHPVSTFEGHYWVLLDLNDKCLRIVSGPGTVTLD